MTDITTEFLQILLTREVADRSWTRALGNIEFQRLTLHRLIGIDRCVEIGQFYRRYIIMSLMTRHDEDIVCDRALCTIGCQLRLIRRLRLILVKVFWQVYLRLLDELQIACTTDRDTQRHRIIGLRLCLVQLG